MLRLIFVSGIIVVGVYFAFQAPFYALLFYLWNAYFRPEAWAWGDIIANLDLSYIIGAYLVVAVLLAQVPLRFGGRILLLVLFSVQSLISALCSQHLALSWGYWVEFSRIILITYLLVLLVDDLRKLRLTLLVIALSLGFEGAKQGWLGIILHPGSENFNPIKFLGDNNGVAVGMLMLVPVLLLLAQTSERRWERFLHYFLLIGVLYRGLSTYSRGAFVASIVLAGAYWLRSPSKLRHLVGGIVFVTPLLLLFSSAYWERMQSIREVAETEDTSILGRMHFWQVAVLMGNDNPLVGCGFRAYEACYDRYDFSRGEYRTKRAAHSSWFGVLGDQGYVGLALYVAVIVSALRACSVVRRLCRLYSKPPELEHYANALEASLWAFIAAGSFLSFQYNEMSWHFFGLAFVLEAIARGSEEDSSGEAGTPRDAEAVADTGPGLSPAQAGGWR